MLFELPLVSTLRGEMGLQHFLSLYANRETEITG